MGQTKDYLQELYCQSVENVRTDFGTKGAFVILALKVCLIAIAAGLLAGLNLIPNTEPVYKIVLSIFASDILGLIVLWAITPLAALFRIPQIAACRDAEQKEKIKSWAESSVELEFSPYVSPDSQTYSLIITNPDSRKIVNLRVELAQNGLKQISNGTKVSRLDHDISLTNREFRDGSRFIDPKTIFGEDHVFVDIWKIKDNQMVLLLTPNITTDHYHEINDRLKIAEFFVDFVIDANLEDGRRIKRQWFRSAVFFESKSVYYFNEHGNQRSKWESKLCIK